MKRTLLILALLAMLFSVPMTGQPDDSQANDLDSCARCKTESRIDRQIRLVNEQAQRTGWIDESTERD